MSATSAVRATEMGAPAPVSTIEGFLVDLSRYDFRPEDRNPIATLLFSLRALCGSIHPESRDVVADRSRWRTLREVSATAVAAAIATTERQCQPWRLGSSDELPPMDAVDRIFARAARRPPA